MWGVITLIPGPVCASSDIWRRRLEVVIPRRAVHVSLALCHISSNFSVSKPSRTLITPSVVRRYVQIKENI